MKKLNTQNIFAVLGIASLIFTAGLLMSFQSEKKATTEFTSFTVVESIVPNGIGRSRIIQSLEPRDYKEFTKTMSSDDKSRNKSDRGEIRVFNYEETKILNFYNIGGIRFQNIAANDAVVKSKVNAMLADGWEIVSINSGVESFSGKEDTNGIFITRYYFKKTS